LPRKGDPLLVATPTFQPVPCNFNSGALPGGGLDTVTGALNAFWSQVAVLEPGRWELGSILRGLAFGDDDSSAGNEIYSGPDANTNQGDNQDKTLGDLGLIPRMLTATVDSAGDGLVSDFGAGRLWLTNILFTDSAIKKLGAGFRAAEQFNGDKSALANNDDTTAFGVNLQFGLMVDELSNGYPLTLGSSNTVPPRNQRTCFLETRVATGGNPVTRAVDEHTIGPTLAVNSDGSPGDGCSLPNVWVKSRWSEDLVYPGSGVDWANSVAANSGAVESEFVLGPQSFSGPDRADLLRLQALARDNDVAVIPFWWKSGTILPIDRPFLAFVNQTDLADWPIDVSNAKVTTAFGFDCSFIRNAVVAMYNIQSPKDSSMITALLPAPSVDLISAKSYNPLLMLGAADPIISFDAESSRFSISGLHTATTISQGPVQAPGQGSDPTDNPEQSVVEISALGSLAPGEQTTHGTGSWRPRFLDVLQSPSKIGSVVDSQSGVAIVGLRAPSVTGEMIEITNDNFSDSLLGHCGFSFEQLLPMVGSTQARFVNRPGGATALTYETVMATIPRPFTTNAFLSSAEYQSLGLDASGRPTYSLGTASWQETRPSAVSADLTASSLPLLLDYPYLMVHSDVFAECAGIDYRAGNSAISPCFGWVSRSESAGDFIYGSLSSFSFIATKSSALTSIEVAIRDPTGRLAALQKNNIVVFKITRPFAGMPSPPTPPPPQK